MHAFEKLQLRSAAHTTHWEMVIASASEVGILRAFADRHSRPSCPNTQTRKRLLARSRLMSHFEHPHSRPTYTSSPSSLSLWRTMLCTPPTVRDLSLWSPSLFLVLSRRRGPCCRGTRSGRAACS